MGEIAEMMLDGTMCQGCGVFLFEGADGPGFPMFCEGCGGDGWEGEDFDVISDLDRGD